jgi:hypothetical protein
MNEEEETIMILGEPMPKDMFNDFADMISPILKGHKFSCAPKDFVCPICMEEKNEPIIMVECEHMYHINCIENWVKIRNNCPCCRNVLPSCNKDLVEELLTKTRETMKMAILSSWCDKLKVLGDEDVNAVQRKMNEFVKSQGWR